jgi:hypothetical protein
LRPKRNKDPEQGLSWFDPFDLLIASNFGFV